ncbi:LacI family DNA-binding transcriptional regulator [Pedobacter frigiditerrae]|uniref:LacI family DNA-binding transcriptional regulator n=1 Tax=Pedobacter frigiditerrae TaxID=2530452 RepID=UPI00292FCCDA|nr:LacI family DNA-binding transcriptional regulator [Pedobacter frigiditerrae]
MKKLTTIYDIASALGITVSTVSRALRDFPGTSESTRKTVIDMAAKLDYRPNKLASALKSGKTFIIGIIVPSIEAHFFASIIHSIEDELKESHRFVAFVCGLGDADFKLFFGRFATDC